MKFVHKKKGKYFWYFDILVHKTSCPHKTGYVKPGTTAQNTEPVRKMSDAHISGSLKYALKKYFFNMPKTKTNVVVGRTCYAQDEPPIRFDYANVVDESYSGKRMNIGGVVKKVIIDNADPKNTFAKITFNLVGKHIIEASFDKYYIRRYPHIYEELQKLYLINKDKLYDEDLVFICYGEVRVEKTAIRVRAINDKSLLYEIGKKDANIIMRKYKLRAD